jgi:LDH2 family malate/lactate/ureidoglycolate dehydrogenase
LILERAAELAVEKAREMAIGLVRVVRVGPVSSAAAVTGGIALGPMAGFALGPGHSWSLALPSEAGLPVVVDSGLMGCEAALKPSADRARKASPQSPAPDGFAGLHEGLALAALVLLPPGCSLVAAVSIPTFEPLTTFQERLSATWEGQSGAAGRLLPASWDAQRRKAREQGISIPVPARKSLSEWSRRLVVEFPKPYDADASST